MKRSSFLCCALLLSLWTTNIYADDPRLVIDVGGHTSLIKDVIFTRDGKYLVSAGEDKVIRVWEVATGKIARTIRGQIGDGPEGRIDAAALSPDNKYLAVGGWLAGNTEDSHAIRIHDFQSGEVIGLLRGHENVVLTLDFSPDGRYLVSGSADKTASVWDIASKPMKEVHVLPGHTDHIYAVAFSPDGRRIVSGSNDKTLRLWDARQGSLIKEMERRHTDKVWTVAFSPNGRYLASGSRDRRILLWDATTGEFRNDVGRQETDVESLSFSPDGNWLLTGSGPGDRGVCNIFSIPSGQVITQFKEHRDIVLATAISPDGKTAATAGGVDNEIHLWNPHSGKIVRKLVGEGRNVWAVGFERDGKSIAFGNESSYQNPNQRGPLQKAILLQQESEYQVELAGEVKDEKQFLRALEVHGDYELKLGDGQVSSDPQLQINKGGQKHRVITLGATSGYRHRCYTFTLDGRYIVRGAGNGALALNKTETGERVREFVGHTGDIWSVAVSPDNRTLVSGSHDQTVRLWDIETGKNLLTIFVASDDQWVAWTPEGYYTSSLNGDKYIGWHLNQGVDRAAKYYSAAQFQKQFYRPDVVAQYLETRDIRVALARADANSSARPRTDRPSATKKNADSPEGESELITGANILTFAPPIIHVEKPEKKESIVEDETLTVKAFAFTTSLPITDVKVFLNGVRVAASPGDHRRVPVEMQVPLQAGTNTLSIIASNEKATSEPETRKITYTPRAGSRKSDDKPNLVLLAVGISEYQHDRLVDLSYADRDAQGIAETLKKQEGSVAFNSVKTLVIPNEKADRETIIKGLSWLNKEATQKDVRVLFLSGHGGLDKQDNYYFFTHKHNPDDDLDIYDVKWTTLMDKLTAVPGKAVLFVDTCRAAAVARGVKRKSDVDFTKVLKDLNNGYGGIVTFAASTGREVSIEKEEWKHGAFTKALLEGLSGKAKNQNGVIYIHDLGSWVIDRVKELTGGEQHAIYSPPPDLPSFPIFVVP